MKNRLVLFVIMIVTGFASDVYASNDPYDFVAVSPSGHFLRYKINNYDTTSVIVAGHEGDDVGGNLIIPSSVTHNGVSYIVNNIGSSAFQYCSITSVSIPNSVGVIGDGAFRRCSNLASVSLPESLRVILQSAFVQCTSLVNIVLPDSLEGVYMQAFYECMGLRKISIPASVGIFAMQAFRACYSLDTIEYRGTIEDWCNITFIDYLSNPLYYGHNLYINGNKVTDLVIPSSVDVIKDYAFNGCKMTRLFISDGVDTIRRNAFDCCDSIRHLYLGKSVKTIAEKAFYGCGSIDTIFSYATNPPLLDWNTFGGEFDWETWFYNGVADSVPIIIPCGTSAIYQQIWSNFNNFLTKIPSFNVSVSSSDSLQGEAFANDLNCDSTVTLTAIPNAGFIFVQWNDGNTANPRTVVLTTDTSFTALFAVDTTEENNQHGGTTSSNVWRIWSKCMNAEPSTYFDVDLTPSNNSQIVNIGPIVHYPFPYKLTLTGTYNVTTNTLVIDIRNDIEEFGDWIHIRTDRHTTQLTAGTILDVVGVLTYNGAAGCTTAIDLQHLEDNYVDSAVCPMPTDIIATNLGCGDVEVRIIGANGSSLRIAYADSTESFSADVVDTVYIINGLSTEKTYTISVTAICENGELSPSVSTSIQPHCDTQPDSSFDYCDTLYIHDTITATEYVLLHDTVNVTEYVPIHDTVTVTEYEIVHDTVNITEYVPIHDTTFITLLDTIEVTVVDTVFIIETDTINMNIIDSIVVILHVTVNQIINDTTTVFVTDTLWINDTVILHDTIYIFDTIVLGMSETSNTAARIYTTNNQIVVDGANGENVYLYDINGRLLATKNDVYSQLRFELSTTGVYFVKIGSKPTRKIVVLK